MSKLRRLELGDYCFEKGRKIYLLSRRPEGASRADCSNLRQMIFGKKCFRAIVDEDLTLCGEACENGVRDRPAEAGDAVLR